MARNSIGVVLVGGMSIGTLFTLFIVPSLYILIARDHRKGREPEAVPERDEPGRDEVPVAAPVGVGQAAMTPVEG